MSDSLPTPRARNTFERIKRVNASGTAFWSARDLARVLEYTDYRNFSAVIARAREACANSGHAVGDHFVAINEMVIIGSGAQRPVEDSPRKHQEGGKPRAEAVQVRSKNIAEHRRDAKARPIG